jgi:hypothetical protein
MRVVRCGLRFGSTFEYNRVEQTQVQMQRDGDRDRERQRERKRDRDRWRGRGRPEAQTTCVTPWRKFGAYSAPNIRTHVYAYISSLGNRV